MDGANAWQRFRFVTWPNLRYLVVVASTLDIINTIRHYDIIGVMTQGGPGGRAPRFCRCCSTTRRFAANRFGEAAAIGVAAARARARVRDLLRAAHAPGPAGDRGMTRAAALRNALLWVGDAGGARVVTIFPFYWMLNTSLKPPVGGVRCRRRRSSPRTGRWTRTRRSSTHAPGRPLFRQQPDRRRRRDRIVGERCPRSAAYGLHALLPARRDAVRDVPAVHEDAAGDAADHPVLPADVGRSGCSTPISR